MSKMNAFEILSLMTYVWSLLQLFCFNNWTYVIPVMLHLFIAKLFYFDEKNTKGTGTQMDEIVEIVMKSDASTSTHDIPDGQNPFLNQSTTVNNPFIYAVSSSETLKAFTTNDSSSETLKALTANDSPSESTIDEALALWKPYEQSKMCSNITNPFLNPFFDMLKLEDPLALLEEASDDGQLACAKWVAKHQDLFLAQSDPDS